MIQELKVKNFLSFKNEVTISFEATKDKKFEDYQVVEVAPNVRLLRLAIVYGANASGKSNLINAFEFLNRFWEKTPNNREVPTGVIPFLLDKHTPEEPSQLSLTFYIGATKYLYALELTNEKVISERLSIYPGSQPALIFDRSYSHGISEINFNQNRVKISQIANEEIAVKCLPNMSVFSAYKQVNVSLPEMEAVITWMKNQYLSAIQPGMILRNFSEELLSKDKSVKEYILDFLHKADFNIADINSEVVDKKVPAELLNMLVKDNDITIEERERLKREKTLKRTQTTFVHKVTNSKGDEEYFSLPKNLQSEGTLRTFGLAGVINHIVKNEAFVPIDEIESSLHPKLIEFFIENFFKQKGQSQLLLTTHYDGLLEEDDLLRNDSIWFTNKGDDGSTELYSLSDFKGLNRITSLQKAYKYGKFGATPNI